LPDFYSSYRIWVNGNEVASNGTVGTSRKESEAQWKPQTVVFPVNSDTLHIVMQVSNFQHHKGGCNDHIYLGAADQLFQKREKAVTTNVILFGGLSLIGFFFIILYFFFRHEKAALYFAAICITWAIRSVFNNMYLFINWVPNLDWELGAKIEYLTLYLTMMWSILFVAKLFPEDINPKVKYTMLILNTVFILLTLATPAFTYSTLLPAYMVVAWLILTYVAYVVIMALIYERKGAWFSAVSIFLGVIMFSYDMLTHSDLFDFNPLLFNIGYITIFLLNATAFAYQLSQTMKPKEKAEFEWSLK
ncbi:MAG TPA: 7TM-DISM domain-containing protein, partial [Cyclobacteriaceae bacterium]